ncbi:MAG: hypothetical protein HOP34_06775 [Methylococcaceae bacterium]|nr:hypothetical protein [Methylococcaceae bacterium]
MKLLKILAASFSLAAATACSTAYADDGIPFEILDFAARTGLVVHQSAAAITNKYPLAGKTVKLTGKLSISGKASYMGRSFKFNAPGDKTAIQHATYTFGQPLANGSIPFKLNHLYGNFDGVMTATKPDQYELRMNDEQGSILSALTYIARTSTGDTWKNTLYSYTAVATQKKVKGVLTTYVEIKEKAGFKISISGLNGASASYTYSYDWKSAVE